GHALIVAGNINTMGAAILNSLGALHSGVGLVSVCIPAEGLTALNSTIPEAMYVSREDVLQNKDLIKYAAIAVGSGLGVSEEAVKIVEHLITQQVPSVLDADALNILSAQKLLLNNLPANTIITPHIKEFDRLFGEHSTCWSRLQTARRVALERDIIIVLKNQYTFICTPKNKVYINCTGNPAMAQGGMGDVLTGITASLLAQGYSSLDAAIIACYVHGKAGDTIAKNKMIATASEVAKQVAVEMRDICCVL
ncbi:MAG: NAD(P)H-hydrate dehydratase, partial [Gallicola sp.]|nr:NAD(P)H-hydrate dehydratase [Gallicola sp.]